MTCLMTDTARVETPNRGASNRLFGIGAKLYLCLGASFAIIFVASLVGAYAVLHARSLEQHTVEHNIPELQQTFTLAQRIASLVVAGHHRIANDHPDSVAIRKANYRQAMMLVDRSLGAVEKLMSDEHELSVIRTGLDQFQEGVQDAIGSPYGLEAIREAELSLLSDAERLVLDARQRASGIIVESSSALFRALLLFLALNLVGFITLVVSGWVFVRRVIVRRIQLVAAATRRMVAGDLETSINVGGRDEMTDMAHALDIFRDHAREVQRLNLVEKLSVELGQKNTALEEAMSNLQRVQQQVVLQEKLAALGQLAAGVAHEIKNPLNFVRNFAIGAQQRAEEIRELSPTPKKEEDIDELNELLGDVDYNLSKVVEHSDRADRIVRAMLEHSRTSSGPATPVDVNMLLNEFSKLAYHSQRALDPAFNLNINYDLDEDARVVLGVPQDLGRVFLNLITNACQATVKRKAAANGDYRPELCVASSRDGDRIEIRLRDNGTGIEPSIRERIFEPFFTTKHADSGTGLGLSISHDIIRAHGGELSVDSEEGEFTEFLVSLPRSDGVPGPSSSSWA